MYLLLLPMPPPPMPTFHWDHLTELYVKILTPLTPDRLRLPVFAIGTLFSAVVTVIVYFSTEPSISSESIFGMD